MALLNPIPGVTGRTCIMLGANDSCTLHTLYPEMAAKEGAIVSADGTCGALDSDLCPAAGTREAIRQSKQRISEEFIRGGEREV